jgi:hypothetical protein
MRPPIERLRRYESWDSESATACGEESYAALGRLHLGKRRLPLSEDLFRIAGSWTAETSWQEMS